MGNINIYTKETARVKTGEQHAVWQYSSEYCKDGMIFHNDPVTGESTEYYVRGNYAPKRLQFLAANARQWVYDTYPR